MIKRLHLKRPVQLTDKSAVTKKIRRPASFHPVDSIHAPIDSLTCQLSIRVNFSSSAWFVRPLADENERPFGWRSSDVSATFRPMSTGRKSSKKFKHGTVVLPTLSSIERAQSKRHPMENGAAKSAARARFVRFDSTCTESDIEPLSKLISHPVNEGVAPAH